MRLPMSRVSFSLVNILAPSPPAWQSIQIVTREKWYKFKPSKERKFCREHFTGSWIYHLINCFTSQVLVLLPETGALWKLGTRARRELEEHIGPSDFRVTSYELCFPRWRSYPIKITLHLLRLLRLLLPHHPRILFPGYIHYLTLPLYIMPASTPTLFQLL